MLSEQIHGDLCADTKHEVLPFTCRLHGLWAELGHIGNK